MLTPDDIERSERANEKDTSRYPLVCNVPKTRLVDVIEGKDYLKRTIETAFSIHLTMDIDSSTGRIEFLFEKEEVRQKLADKIREILEAIALGFELNQALSLCQDEVRLRTCDLHDLAPRKYARRIRRVRARIVGREGSCKRKLEALSDVSLALEGHRISIIGKTEGTKACYNAIRMLAEGKAHERAYGFLERFRSEARKRRQLQVYRPAIQGEE